MICRQLRITAKSADDAATYMIDKWPGWTVKVKSVGVIAGENWYEITLVKEDAKT